MPLETALVVGVGGGGGLMARLKKIVLSEQPCFTSVWIGMSSVSSSSYWIVVVHYRPPGLDGWFSSTS